MAYSFEQVINTLNNAVNEITRAARDFGDERSEDEPVVQELRELAAQAGEVLTTLQNERDRIAAAGTSSDVAIKEPAPPMASQAAAPAKPPAPAESTKPKP